MSDRIAFDRGSMDDIFAAMTTDADALANSLDPLPDAVDGGIATELMATLIAAGVEAAGLAVDAERALVVIARDVLDDFAADEAAAAAELDGWARDLDS